MTDSQPERYEFNELSEADTSAHWAALRTNARDIQIPESFTTSVAMREDGTMVAVLVEFHRLERSPMDAHIVSLLPADAQILIDQIALALNSHEL